MTASYFDVLGVAFAVGRPFTAEEDAPGRPSPVAVISDRLWSSLFARSPSALGADDARQRRRAHRRRHHGAGLSGHGPRAGQRSLDAGQSLRARQPWTRRRGLARGRRILRVGGAAGAGRQRPAGASGAADAHRMARRAIPGSEQEVHAAGQASRARSDRRRSTPAEPAVDIARR